MCAKNVLRPCSKTTFACTAAGLCCPIIDPGQISHCVAGQKTEQFPPWCSGYEGGEKLYIFKVLLLCPNNAVGDTSSGICPMLSLCKHTLHRQYDPGGNIPYITSPHSTSLYE